MRQFAVELTARVDVTVRIVAPGEPDRDISVGHGAIAYVFGDRTILCVQRQVRIGKGNVLS
ncbi:MAG TPA: hypothetical protein VL522_02675, partial [Bordetella sp.]|nr:hypothetical protein [Bordetella sp.]